MLPSQPAFVMGQTEPCYIDYTITAKVVALQCGNGCEVYEEGLDLRQIQTDCNLIHFAEQDLMKVKIKTKMKHK